MNTRKPVGFRAVAFLAAIVILSSVVPATPQTHRNAGKAAVPPAFLSRLHTDRSAGLRLPAFLVPNASSTRSIRDLSPAAAADPIIELAELTVTDGGIGDFLGFAVAISGDTIVVGSPEHTVGQNAHQGAAYVYVKPAGGWASTSTFTAELTASDGLPSDDFGLAVGISGDTIVVGACSLTGVCTNGPGKAYIFTKPESGWSTTSTFTAELTASDGVAADAFGLPVAISEDGNTVVVGTQQVIGAATPGKAYVYAKPPDGWSNMTETAELTPSDSVTGDGFGEVAVSGDGATVFVGAPFATINSNSVQGSAYIFIKPPNGWVSTSTFAAKLTPSDGQALDYFALCQNSGCISADGKTVLVGAPQLGDTSGSGAGVGKAYIFLKPANGWASTSNFDAELAPSDGALGDAFGFSVALSNSGDQAFLGSVVASPMLHGQGAIYQYNRPSGGWATTAIFDDKLVANNPGAGDNLGFAVALDQGTVVGGAVGLAVGAAYVFGQGEPFGISAASGVNVSSPGQTGSTSLTISPNGGFSGTVNLSCTPDARANESGCGFTSGSTTSSTLPVTLNGSSVNVTFNVTTMGPHTVSALRQVSPGSRGGPAAIAFMALLIPVVRRRRRASLCFTSFAIVLMLGACGGGGSTGGGGGHTDPGTAAGNYTFTVTGTTGSGSSASTVTTTVAVDVQ